MVLQLTIGMFVLCLLLTMVFYLNSRTSTLLKLKERKADFLEIKLPPALLWLELTLGSLCGIACIGITAFPQFFHIAIYAPCMAFMLIFFLLAYGALSWRLVMLGESFVYRSFFRTKYRLRYTEVTSYKLTNHFLHVRTRNNHFLMSTYATKLPVFFNHLRMVFGEVSSAQADYDFIM